MSQHNTLVSTRKKITSLAIGLALALAPVAVPGLASASTETSGDNSGYEEKTATTSYSEQEEWGKKERPKSSDNDGYTPYAPKHTTAKPAHNDEDCPEDVTYGNNGSSHKDKKQDKDKKYHHDKDFKKDHKKKPDEKPVKETVKVIKEEKPPKVIEKKVVKEVVKPAEVRQEVKQQINQETHVTVQQQKEKVVAAKPEPQPVQERKVTKTVVHEQPVAAAAAEPATQPPVVPAVGGKGALEETGSETTANTAAGLGILSALGALHIISRRRKANAANPSQE